MGRVSGSLTVGHVSLGVSRLIAKQVQNRADLATNSGKVSKILHLIPAPFKILPTKLRHYINFPELSWSEL